MYLPTAFVCESYLLSQSKHNPQVAVTWGKGKFFPIWNRKVPLITYLQITALRTSYVYTLSWLVSRNNLCVCVVYTKWCTQRPEDTEHLALSLSASVPWDRGYHWTCTRLGPARSSNPPVFVPVPSPTPWSCRCALAPSWLGTGTWTQGLKSAPLNLESHLSSASWHNLKTCISSNMFCRRSTWA